MGVGGEHLPQVSLQYFRYAPPCVLFLQDFLICFGVCFLSSEQRLGLPGFSGGPNLGPPESTHAEASETSAPAVARESTEKRSIASFIVWAVVGYLRTKAVPQSDAHGARREQRGRRRRRRRRVRGGGREGGGEVEKRVHGSACEG